MDMNKQNQDLNKYFLQTSSQIPSVNTQQSGNVDLNKYYLNYNTTTPNIGFNEFAFNTNSQIEGGIDMSKYLQQNTKQTQGDIDINKLLQGNTTTNTTYITGTPVTKEEDLSKYFQKAVTQTTNLKGIGNIDMKDLPQVFGSSDINKAKQTTTTTTYTTTGNIDMKDLPAVFGSSDINKAKQTTTTTT